MASTSTETGAPVLELTALASFLAAQVGPLAGSLEAELIAGGRSNPTYELTDGIRSWVLRRPPFGLVLETAHDMSRERRVISALADTAVPVPRVVAHSTDGRLLGAPFYVME
jgi:aminoglycoside phosphotransferase (APT) family kinase protein